MGKTPKPPAGQNAETMTYPAPGKHTTVGKGGKSSYTPSAAINPFGYGKDGGKAAFQNPPSVVVGGSSEAQAPPAMPGTLKIGDDKNVSTPVTGN